MHNVVEDADGSRHNIMILPDNACVVNQGLSSVRGGQMATYMYTPDGDSKARLKEPRLYTAAQWVDTTWDEALALYCGVAKKVLDKDGPSGLVFNCFDHGGAGGGFENTWGTGKLMFTALQTEMVRIHNRPAYNSECHATRDMGVGELNNAYEDAELADCIMGIGANQYETQTNYFLAHWVPNIQGGTADKSKKFFPGEPLPENGRVIFVDPRRTNTIAVAEQIAARTACCISTSSPALTLRCSMASSPTSSTRAGSTATSSRSTRRGFDAAVAANKLSLDECSRITGIPVAKLKQAAEWAYKPKAPGVSPRTMHAYEKGIIWGNDNYLIQSALVDLVLATRNVGRRGTGCVRMGGHQEGYTRPPYPGEEQDLHRRGVDEGQGQDADRVGLQQLPDHAERAGLPDRDPSPGQHREGCDGAGAWRQHGTDGRRGRWRPETRGAFS